MYECPKCGDTSRVHKCADRGARLRERAEKAEAAARQAYTDAGLLLVERDRARAELSRERHTVRGVLGILTDAGDVRCDDAEAGVRALVAQRDEARAEAGRLRGLLSELNQSSGVVRGMSEDWWRRFAAALDHREAGDADTIVDELVRKRGPRGDSEVLGCPECPKYAGKCGACGRPRPWHRGVAPPRDVEAEARALGWWEDDAGDWYSKRGHMTWGSEAWEPEISCGPGGWVKCASRYEALAYALDHREADEG